MNRRLEKATDTSLAVWDEELTQARDVAARRRCAFVQAVLERGADRFILRARGRPLLVQPLTTDYQSRAVRAYRAIWYYADAYRETWTEADASRALNGLSECFVAVDELDNVVALAGGKPLRKGDDDQLGTAAADLDRTYYLAELGRVPLVKDTRVGTCLFELMILAAARQGYGGFLLTTARAADVLAPDEPNPARQLYQDHGFQLLRGPKGEVLGQSYSQRRTNGRVITDWRPYYYVTTPAFFENVGLRSKINSSEQDG